MLFSLHAYCRIPGCYGRVKVHTSHAKLCFYFLYDIYLDTFSSALYSFLNIANYIPHNLSPRPRPNCKFILLLLFHPL